MLLILIYSITLKIYLIYITVKYGLFLKKLVGKFFLFFFLTHIHCQERNSQFYSSVWEVIQCLGM